MPLRAAAVFCIITGEKADTMAKKRSISKTIVVGTYRPGKWTVARLGNKSKIKTADIDGKRLKDISDLPLDLAC